MPHQLMIRGPKLPNLWAYILAEHLSQDSGNSQQNLLKVFRLFDIPNSAQKIRRFDPA